MSSANWTIKKVILVTLMLAVGGGALAWGWYDTWASTPPELPQTPDEALETIGTVPYENMPDYRKREYLQHTRRLLDSLPSEQRTALFERTRTNETTRESLGQMHREMMEQRAYEYATSSAARRQEILEEDMRQMEARRKQRAAELAKRAPGTGPPSGIGKRGGGRDAAANATEEDKAKRRAQIQSHFRDRFQEGNPQMGAMIAEYHRALRAMREGG